MKKINLKGITNSLCDGEMKLVKGGWEVQADFDVSAGIGGGVTLTPKQEACKNKLIGDSYSYREEGTNKLRYGTCVDFLQNKLLNTMCLYFFYK